MTVSEFLKAVNPIAERIRQFETFRHTWLLAPNEIELTKALSPSSNPEIKTDLVKIRLKGTEPNSYLVRFFYSESHTLLVQVDPDFNGLKKEQRAIVWGLVASYCNPEKFPNIGDEYLSTFHSSEMSDFFKELYSVHSPLFGTAINILNEFNSGMRSFNASESH